MTTPRHRRWEKPSRESCPDGRKEEKNKKHDGAVSLTKVASRGKEFRGHARRRSLSETHREILGITNGSVVCGAMASISMVKRVETLRGGTAIFAYVVDDRVTRTNLLKIVMAGFTTEVRFDLTRTPKVKFFSKYLGSGTNFTFLPANILTLVCITFSECYGSSSPPTLSLSTRSSRRGSSAACLGVPAVFSGKMGVAAYHHDKKTRREEPD